MSGYFNTLKNQTKFKENIGSPIEKNLFLVFIFLIIKRYTNTLCNGHCSQIKRLLKSSDQMIKHQNFLVEGLLD